MFSVSVNEPWDIRITGKKHLWWNNKGRIDTDPADTKQQDMEFSKAKGGLWTGKDHTRGFSIIADKFVLPFTQHPRF